MSCVSIKVERTLVLPLSFTLFPGASLHFHCFVVVFPCELLEPVHDLAATCLPQTCDYRFNRIVTILLLVCQELQRVDQVFAGTLWCRMSSKNYCFSGIRAVLYDKYSVHSPPIILAATCTPPAAQFLPDQRRPTKCTSNGKQ